jgi:hypothetical protein
MAVSLRGRWRAPGASAAYVVRMEEMARILRTRQIRVKEKR